MEDLYSFLEQTSKQSDFKANLSERGGFITFSNSGRRGSVKYFQIGLDNILQTLKDILKHIDIFGKFTEYDERTWRDNGAEYFEDPVANANSTVQTKPLFSTLSKVIKWANQPNLDYIDPDQQILLTAETLAKAIEKLEAIAETFRPKISPRTESINPKTSISSRQIIYYGAPGTGKSHEVKKLAGERLGIGDEVDLPNVFRTTFHPDTDYASFVGCYKPAMESKETIYTQAQLIDKLSIIKNSGASYPCQKFGAKYWESLKELSANDIKQILTACGFTDSMSVEVPKGIAIGEEFASMSSNKQIVYRFVPQVFTNAYVYAYTTQEPTYLVIEEINRGNCAQIFGDLFQLLDRKNGKSEYKIKADNDLAQYLREQLGTDSEGIQDGKLCLPANLHILATMNTSDQSLFPMDSAFKRRWDWEYVPINYGTGIQSGSFEITIGDKSYSWVDFIKQVNEKIFDLTQSEDKQMGNFFIKHSINEDGFKSKVMFYLWYEVLRDETENNKYFFYKKTTLDGREVSSKFTFKDLYGDHATETLQQFMEYLKVSPK